jgi:hypothetical protein
LGELLGKAIQPHFYQGKPLCRDIMQLARNAAALFLLRECQPA